MKLIEYGVFTGQENMQIDSDLLEGAISNQSQKPVFRLYGWSPKCISLGRNQKDNFIKSHDIDVVRRLTGGRALLHDDEITYSCVFPINYIPSGESVALSYKYISGILIDFFKTLGINLILSIKLILLFLNLKNLKAGAPSTNFFISLYLLAK